MIVPKVPRPSKTDERHAYEAVTIRDAGKCVRCGWYGAAQRDHRKNRSQGGLTTVSDLQLLCGPHGNTPGCHTWKTENPAAAILEGFAVPSWAHPEFWPAWRDDVQSWVIYLDRPDSQGRWWSEITQTTADMLMNGGHV